MDKELNIVTLNIPYPPDYGGMIDSFYRIKAFSEAGVIIHLHCFEYGRSRNKILESYCKTVSYYKRRFSIQDFLSRVPYIIKSRSSNDLLKNLLSNNFPILFDGIHTTYFINHPGFHGRKLFLRTHNIEHQYYRNLAHAEKNPLRKIFYLSEAAKLSKYENKIRSTVNFFTITEQDKDFFSGCYSNVFYIPPFHPFDKVTSIPGKGEYVLYHGDLSVNLNENVVIDLIERVFTKVTYRLIIAGKNPSDRLFRKAKEFNNIEIIANPDPDLMNDLISKAHINLLPATGNSGFKIKLLYALFSGRFVVSNSEITKQFEENEIFVNADTPEEIISSVNRLMNKEFSEEMINKRSEFLDRYFSNKKIAAKMIKIIFGDN